MATTSEIVDALKQNLTDISGVADQLIAFIVAADAVHADLRAQIDALVANDAALAAQVTEAFDQSAAIEDKMRAAVPGVPPIGGEPLLQSYADNAAFMAAVSAYTGPEAVTLDGVEVKAGTMPSLDYFSHSADGSVSMTGPTD